MNLDPEFSISVTARLRWPLAFGIVAWKYRSHTLPKSWGRYRYWTLGLGPITLEITVSRYTR